MLVEDAAQPEIRVETEPSLPNPPKPEVLDPSKVSGFFRIQRKTIEDLNIENQALRDEIDRLQREMSKSSIEAIKQVQQELSKALEKQKLENDTLQQKMEAAYKEIEAVKEASKQQLGKKDEEIKRIVTENKKMKEYTDTLMRTRADIFKVVAMEKMLNDMVGQLSKMTEKCKQQQIELDKKEQEAQKIHEVVQRLEKESKSYAAIAKYLTLKSKLDPAKDLNESRTQRDILDRSFARLGKPDKMMDSSFFKEQPSFAKIVKPIKGGAPPVKPIIGHARTKTGIPQLQLNGIARADTFREGKGEWARNSALENPAMSGVRLSTPRAEIPATTRDKTYVQNLRKFDMILETQKAVAHSSVSSSSDSEDDNGGNVGAKTDRRRHQGNEIAEKLFG